MLREGPLILLVAIIGLCDAEVSTLSPDELPMGMLSAVASAGAQIDAQRKHLRAMRDSTNHAKTLIHTASQAVKGLQKDMDKVYKTVSGLGGRKELDDLDKIAADEVTKDPISAKLESTQKAKAELLAAQANYKAAEERKYKAEAKAGLVERKDGDIDPRANAAVEHMFSSNDVKPKPDEDALTIAKSFNQNAHRAAAAIDTAEKMTDAGVDPNINNAGAGAEKVGLEMRKKVTLDSVVDKVQNEPKLPPLDTTETDEEAVSRQKVEASQKGSPAKEDESEPTMGEGLMDAVSFEEEELEPDN